MLLYFGGLETTAFRNNEAWLSLVERCVRDAEVAGSNPVASTTKNDCNSSRFLIMILKYFDLPSIPPGQDLVLIKFLVGETGIFICLSCSKLVIVGNA